MQLVGLAVIREPIARSGHPPRFSPSPSPQPLPVVLPVQPVV